MVTLSRILFPSLEIDVYSSIILRCGAVGMSEPDAGQTIASTQPTPPADGSKTDEEIAQQVKVLSCRFHVTRTEVHCFLHNRLANLFLLS